MKKIAAGFYSKTGKLTKPMTEAYNYPIVKDEIDNTEGKHRVGMDDDSRHTIFEIYVDLDIKGLEDTNELGEATGVALPYIVWVNSDDHEILRVQRNYLPDDEMKNAKVNVAHYRFMPGLGFYGYGLLHLIGGLANSATGTLRALLDSAAFANLQGGYRTRDSRVKGGDQPLAPGEWREVDISAEDLAKAFYRVPYEEPSQTLYNLLGYLDDRGNKFIGGDVMTGDANPNAPVGTTLALIEQGGKTFSAIHKRLHVAHRKEFKILARLNSEYLPEEGYPYYTKDGEKNVMPTDFDARVDIVPVSDPAIVSQTQRALQAQAVMDLAEKHPDKVDVTAALKMLLEVMRIPNIDDLLKVNEEMVAQQQKMAELEMQLKQAEINKVDAETAEIQAKKTESYLRGMFSSFQSAQLAQGGLAPIADSLYLSADGKDFNSGNMMDLSGMPQISQQDVVQPDANTSPGFPAQPQLMPVPKPEEPTAPMPISADTGLYKGAETQDLTD